MAYRGKTRFRKRYSTLPLLKRTIKWTVMLRRRIFWLKRTQQKMFQKNIYCKPIITNSCSAVGLTGRLTINGGRNNTGRIAIFHRGGSSVKRRYRILDFTRKFLNLPGIVRHIEYDPNRTSFIALICYISGVISYILAYDGIYVGNIIISGEFNVGLVGGNSRLLYQYGKGILLHDIDGIFIKSGGNSGKLINLIFYSKIKQKRLASIIQLPSKELRIYSSILRATCGKVLHNIFYKNIKTAGSRRRLGYRPVVRGVAKNPVDHPHGGGEGKSKSGRCSTSPWGWLTKCSIKTPKKKSFIWKTRNAVRISGHKIIKRLRPSSLEGRKKKNRLKRKERRRRFKREYKKDKKKRKQKQKLN